MQNNSNNDEEAEKIQDDSAYIETDSDGSVKLRDLNCIKASPYTWDGNQLGTILQNRIVVA